MYFFKAQLPLIVEQSEIKRGDVNCSITCKMTNISPNGLDSTSVTNILKNTTTLEFSEHVSMFQTSSSAIVSVTLKFLQHNSYIYIYI